MLPYASSAVTVATNDDPAVAVDGADRSSELAGPGVTATVAEPVTEDVDRSVTVKPSDGAVVSTIPLNVWRPPSPAVKV